MDLILTDREVRQARARRIKTLPDIPGFPSLKFWNYSACAAHDEPTVGCEYRACGGDFFNYQRVGISWLLMNQKGLLADSTGLGKTNQILGLAALLKERGELTDRMLIVCQSAAALQWFEEAGRWIPRVPVEVMYSGLTRGERRARYTQGNWDIIIIGYQMMLQDEDILADFGFSAIIVDDVDPLLNHDTRTHKTIERLSRSTKYGVVINATSIQTRLEQIHAATYIVGGRDVFGTRDAFDYRYVERQSQQVLGSRGRVSTQRVAVGYKRGKELREKLNDLVLRRTYDDVKDVRVPEIAPPQHVWLDLHPAQRQKYDELQKGVLKIIKAGQAGQTIKKTTALTAVGYGQQICAGLPALGEADGPEASVKLDWLMEKLRGEWSDRKVVCFIKNTGLVQAFSDRLDAENIGWARIWGKDANAKNRKAEQDRFWRDPDCRVFMGTASIERSLNLQVANIVVNVDTHLNPARMLQILGRARRVGSKHSHVYVFNLFTRTTQEERYLDVLRKRQAVADFVFEDQNGLYESLSALELLQLIRP